MIISRTPLRASFIGGGTDVKWFYEQHNGTVVSAAIKKYIYIIIHPFLQNNKLRLKYSETEDINNIDNIKHEIIKCVLKKYDIGSGFEIASIADVPSGTGLGSSSSFTVGLLNAIFNLKKIKVSKKIIANEACNIEIDILGKPIGKQDQFAASYGGLNIFTFKKNGNVKVDPINFNKKVIDRINKNYKLYYIPGTRKADTILKYQNFNVEKKVYENLKKINALTPKFIKYFKSKNFYQASKIIDQSWILKRRLSSNVSNKKIDKFYKLIKENGFAGGKLLGAGKSGFFLVYGNNHKTLNNYKSFSLEIDHNGSTIINFNDIKK